MSEFTVCETQIKDLDVLLDTLKEFGYDSTKVEVHEEATNLVGYQNDKRQQKAHVVIRKNNVGSASNDIGFEKQSDGTYTAHVSDYDKARGIGRKIYPSNKGGSGEFVQKYTELMVEKSVAKNKKYKIASKTKEGNKTKIKIVFN